MAPSAHVHLRLVALDTIQAVGQECSVSSRRQRQRRWSSSAESTEPPPPSAYSARTHRVEGEHRKSSAPCPAAINPSIRDAIAFNADRGRSRADSIISCRSLRAMVGSKLGAKLPAAMLVPRRATIAFRSSAPSEVTASGASMPHAFASMRSSAITAQTPMIMHCTGAFGGGEIAALAQVLDAPRHLAESCAGTLGERPWSASQLTPSQREVDREARLTISEELGQRWKSSRNAGQSGGSRCTSK